MAPMDRDSEADRTARVPFTTVLASVVGLWLCYFLLTTLRAHLLDIGFEHAILWRRALACLAGVAVTLGLWAVLRLFDQRPLWAKIVAALLLSVPVSIALAQTNRLVFQDMESRIFTRAATQRGMRVHHSPAGDILVDIPGGGLPDDLTGEVTGEVAGDGPPDPSGAAITISAGSLRSSPSQDFTELVFGRYFMMLAWSSLYLALLTGEKARAAERREGAYRRAAKAAELRSLRYQVNPHFLFNTLNSLSALVLTGRTQAAERMIQTISTFYRRSLADDPTSDVILRQELELQRLYLDIEAVRFPQRLRAVYDLPPELEEACVPGMILQPLVENSVKHAVAPSTRQVTLTIAARTEYGRLVLSVSDDGTGPAPGGEAPRHGFGIGLANVRERLAARFGRDASVASGPVPGGYATHLRLPLVGANEWEQG